MESLFVCKHTELITWRLLLLTRNCFAHSFPRECMKRPLSHLKLFANKFDIILYQNSITRMQDAQLQWKLWRFIPQPQNRHSTTTMMWSRKSAHLGSLAPINSFYHSPLPGVMHCLHHVAKSFVSWEAGWSGFFCCWQWVLIQLSAVYCACEYLPVFCHMLWNVFAYGTWVMGDFVLGLWFEVCFVWCKLSYSLQK